MSCSNLVFEFLNWYFLKGELFLDTCCVLYTVVICELFVRLTATPQSDFGCRDLRLQQKGLEYGFDHHKIALLEFQSQ